MSEPTTPENHTTLRDERTAQFVLERFDAAISEARDALTLALSTFASDRARIAELEAPSPTTTEP